MVRSRRLELPRPFGHQALNLARLPIPPRPHYVTLRGVTRPARAEYQIRIGLASVRSRRSNGAPAAASSPTRRHWRPWRSGSTRSATVARPSWSGCSASAALHRRHQRRRRRAAGRPSASRSTRPAAAAATPIMARASASPTCMLDLKRRGGDIRRYVRQLEELAIRTLAGFGVQGERREGRIGIWVVLPDGSEAKIGAIGVRVRRWVSYHGLAINLVPGAQPFCGYRALRHQRVWCDVARALWACGASFAGSRRRLARELRRRVREGMTGRCNGRPRLLLAAVVLLGLGPGGACRPAPMPPRPAVAVAALPARRDGSDRRRPRAGPTCATARSSAPTCAAPT